MTADILALARQAHALHGADPFLDQAIGLAIGPARCQPCYDMADDPFNLHWRAAPAYTGSLDAALTLVPDDCRLGRLAQRPDGEGRWDCILEMLMGTAGASLAIRCFDGPTAALAVTVAALRLHASLRSGNVSAAA